MTNEELNTALYGFGSRVEWCACFVSWCANQRGYIETVKSEFVCKLL